MNFLRAYLGNFTWCQKDTKPYTHLNEQETLLAGQCLKGRSRDFRSSALERDLWPREWTKMFPCKAPSTQDPLSHEESRRQFGLPLRTVQFRHANHPEKALFVLIPTCFLPCFPSFQRREIWNTIGDPLILFIHKSLFETKDWWCHLQHGLLASPLFFSIPR